MKKSTLGTRKLGSSGLEVSSLGLGCMGMTSFPMITNADMISPRPMLLIAGENAHSRYYSEDVYERAAEPKELMIIPNTDHVDLYDQMDKIPFDKLETFFNENLK